MEEIKVKEACQGFMQHGDFFMNALLDHIFLMLSWWSRPLSVCCIAFDLQILWVPNKDWLIGTDILT